MTIYKGKQINHLKSGWLEIYCDYNQRFLKFDTMTAVKRHINAYKAMLIIKH